MFALLEVVWMLAEGQAEGVQGVAVMFLGTQQQGQQVEGKQVIGAQRQSRL